MDPLTKRSAIASTSVHAVLVVLAWWSGYRNGSPTPPPAPAPAEVAAPEAEPEHKPEAAPQPDPAPKSEPAAAAKTKIPSESDPGDLVMTPGSPAAPAAGAPPPLPTLAAGQSPALPKELPAIISPGPTSFPGVDRNRGAGGSALADLELPAATGTPELSSELRGRTMNPELAREEATRRIAADHLDQRFYDTYKAHWRRFDQLITQRRLVARMVTDARGRVVEAALENSTGVAELDLLINRWLTSPDLGLPPIPPGVIHYFRLSLQ